jgi:phosphatidylethanolamine/phosphatidyl-N-methylethanolamine N-methyltransferase
MIQHMAKRASGRFNDQITFFRAWTRNAKIIGSVWPTSVPMARKMAGVIDLSSGLPVLEIGPGTGPITKQILATGIAPPLVWTLEYSHEFAGKLRTKFPEIQVIEGDAFSLDETLGRKAPQKFDCAISGLPLLNFPVATRVAFVESVLDRLPPGRPLIQFSYGPKSPVPPGFGNYQVRRYGMVLRNVPPAQLWVYSRAAQ